MGTAIEHDWLEAVSLLRAGERIDVAKDADGDLMVSIRKGKRIMPGAFESCVDAEIAIHFVQNWLYAREYQ